MTLIPDHFTLDPPPLLESTKGNTIGNINNIYKTNFNSKTNRGLKIANTPGPGEYNLSLHNRENNLNYPAFGSKSFLGERPLSEQTAISRLYQKEMSDDPIKV